MNQNLLQKKGFLVAVIVVGVNIAALIFGGWFLTSEIVSASKQIVGKETSINDIYQSWQQLSYGQKELQQMETDIAKIDGAFVSLKQPIEFIQTLEDFAKKSGSLYEINLLPAMAEEEKANTLSLQIYLAGNFDSLMHFLVYLENMPYYVMLDSVKISAINLGSKPRDAWSEEEWKAIGPGGVFSVINLKAFTK